MGPLVPPASRGFAGKAKKTRCCSGPCWCREEGSGGSCPRLWCPAPWCPPAPGQGAFPAARADAAEVSQGPLPQHPALPLASPGPWVLAMSSRPETLLNSDSATVPGAGGGRPRAAAVQPPAGSGTGVCAYVCVHAPRARGLSGSQRARLAPWHQPGARALRQLRRGRFPSCPGGQRAEEPIPRRRVLQGTLRAPGKFCPFAATGSAAFR